MSTSFITPTHRQPLWSLRVLIILISMNVWSQLVPGFSGTATSMPMLSGPSHMVHWWWAHSDTKVWSKPLKMWDEFLTALHQCVHLGRGLEEVTLFLSAERGLLVYIKFLVRLLAVDKIYKKPVFPRFITEKDMALRCHFFQKWCDPRSESNPTPLLVSWSLTTSPDSQFSLHWAFCIHWTCVMWLSSRGMITPSRSGLYQAEYPVSPTWFY